LNEGERILGDLADKLCLLGRRGVVYAALKNTATVSVGANSDAVRTYGVEDELRVIGTEVVEALLDDVIAVQILNQPHDLVLQSTDDGSNLLGVSVAPLHELRSTHLRWSGDEFDHLLQCSSAVLVQGDVDHVVGSTHDEVLAHVVIRELEELLTEIVAKGI